MMDGNLQLSFGKISRGAQQDDRESTAAVVMLIRAVNQHGIKVWQPQHGILTMHKRGQGHQQPGHQPWPQQGAKRSSFHRDRKKSISLKHRRFFGMKIITGFEQRVEEANRRSGW